MRAFLWLLVSSVAVVLCSCSSAPPPIAPSSSKPVRLSASVAAGRSPELASGNYRAYWIWRDDDGVWHLRTTARRGHRFQGVVRPLEGAQIGDLKLVGIDPKDRVGIVGRTLSFDWQTRGAIDGFDFRIQGQGCVEFDLRLNEDGSSRYIYLGKDKIRPEAAHFLLCP